MVLYTLYNDTSRLWNSYGGAFTLGFNVSQVSSYKAYLNLTNPAGEQVDNQTLSFDALPSETHELGVSFKPNTTGLWAIEYEILAMDNVTVDRGVQAIAVSDYAYNPGGWAYQEDELSFSLTSESEQYYFGENGTFTFHIWNRGDTSKDVFVAWSFPHHFWETNYDFYGPPGTTRPKLGSMLNNSVTVPAHGYLTFNYTVPILSRGDRLYASFWEDTGSDYSYLSRVSRGIFGRWPYTYTRINAEVDEDYNVTLSLHQKSRSHKDILHNVSITVEDGSGKIYHQENFTKTFSLNEVYEAE
jgi:hypothetical protein